MRWGLLLLVALIASTISDTVAGRNSLLAPCKTSVKHSQRLGRSTLIKTDDSSIEVHLRGGAKEKSCDDPDLVILGKTAMSVAMEAAGLLGVLALSVAISPAIGGLTEKLGFPSNLFGGPPAPQAVAIFVLAFQSSLIGSLIEGGMSAATNQASKPTVTPSAGWYAQLKKPWWNPPGWIFPIMWLIVSKPTQYLAVRKVLTLGQEEGASIPWRILTPYCVHLALGDAWNNVFFGCQRVEVGLQVIVTFYLTLLLSAYLFYQYNPTAGLFLLPTCGWVTIATALNASIYMLNKPSASPLPTKKQKGKK